MKRAVDWHCADCGTELLVPHLIGRREKGRRVVCSKCAKNYKGGVINSQLRGFAG